MARRRIGIVIHPVSELYGAACKPAINRVSDMLDALVVVGMWEDAVYRLKEAYQSYTHYISGDQEIESPRGRGAYQVIDPDDISGLDGCSRIEILLMGGECNLRERDGGLCHPLAYRDLCVWFYCRSPRILHEMTVLVRADCTFDACGRQIDLVRHRNAFLRMYSTANVYWFSVSNSLAQYSHHK